MLSRNLQGRRGLNPLERGVLVVTRPVLQLSSRATGTVRTWWGRYVHLVGVEEKNAGLEAIIDGLEAERTRLLEAERENQRLRQLLGLVERAARPGLAAEVIAEDVRGEYRVIRVNKGVRHGVEAGGAVVTVAGPPSSGVGAVVGKVLEVEDLTSQVLLVVDPRAAVDVLVQRSRAKAVAQGDGTADLGLEFLDRLADVRPGDTVVTSGLGGIFPKGLRVGTIQYARAPDAGLFQDARLDPAVDFARLEEVLILEVEPLPVLPPEPEAAPAAEGAG